MRHLLTLAVLLATALPASAPAQTAAPAPQPPLTLAQVMADPDWIGNGVEDFWWTWDSRAAQFERKRDGATVRDAWQVPVDGSAAMQQVDGAARAGLDASGAVYDATRSRMAFVRNGDVFVRDLRNGALQQLTRSNDQEALPHCGWASWSLLRVSCCSAPLRRSRTNTSPLRTKAMRERVAS